VARTLGDMRTFTLISVAVCAVLSACALGDVPPSGGSQPAPPASIGELVAVAPGTILSVRLANELRTGPGLSSELVAVLRAGERVGVVDGPVAADGLRWYQVQQASRTGWISSGAGHDMLAIISNGKVAVDRLVRDSDIDHTFETVLLAPGAADGEMLFAGSLIQTSWDADGTSYLGSTWDGSIEMVDVDSGRRAIGPGHLPAWSPDGRRLAYLDVSRREIVVMEDDGASSTLVESDRELLELAWSPGGSRIAFIALECEGCVPEPDIGNPSAGLFVVELDSGDVRQLTDGHYDGGLTCAGDLEWSVDGGFIGFVRVEAGHPSLLKVSASTGEVIAVPGGDAVCGGFEWSPDGSQIVVLGRDGIGVADADGANFQLLVSNAGDQHVSRPRWSPDGQEILFWLSCDECEGGWPAVVPASGGAPLEMIVEFASDAAWQPILEPLP
jgi:WD40 repeat protein